MPVRYQWYGTTMHGTVRYSTVQYIPHCTVPIRYGPQFLIDGPSINIVTSRIFVSQEECSNISSSDIAESQVVAFQTVIILIFYHEGRNAGFATITGPYLSEERVQQDSS